MFWHIDTDAVSLIVIAAIYIYNLRLAKTAPEGKMQPQNRRSLTCLHVGMVVTLVDIAASIVMEVPVPRLCYHFFMTLYFVSLELVIVEWILYVITILYDPADRGYRLASRIVLAVYAVYALFALLNPWTGAIYTLGPANEYNRGPLFGLMLILYCAYTLALFLLILVRWRHVRKTYPAFVLILTPFIIGAGIAIQLSVPGLLLIMPAFMICLVLDFLFLQLRRTQRSRDMLQSLSLAAITDNLTGLLNRTGMESAVQRLWTNSVGRDCLVVIVDVDDLKGINDSLGHAEGDRAIMLTAARLKSHFRSSDTVVRYGGDEFLALLSGDFDEERMIDSVCQLTLELAGLQVGADDSRPIHCSVGAAFGVIGTDKFEKLCNKADLALYHVKRNGKNSFAVYQPQLENPGR